MSAVGETYDTDHPPSTCLGWQKVDQCPLQNTCDAGGEQGGGEGCGCHTDHLKTRRSTCTSTSPNISSLSSTTMPVICQTSSWSTLHLTKSISSTKDTPASGPGQDRCLRDDHQDIGGVRSSPCPPQRQSNSLPETFPVHDQPEVCSFRRTATASSKTLLPRSKHSSHRKISCSSPNPKVTLGYCRSTNMRTFPTIQGAIALVLAILSSCAILTAGEFYPLFKNEKLGNILDMCISSCFVGCFCVQMYSNFQDMGDAHIQL